MLAEATARFLLNEVLTARHIAWFLGLTTAWFFIYIVWLLPSYLSPLRKIPGPPRRWNILADEGIDILYEEACMPHLAWVKKYGPVVRAVGPMGLQRVVFTDTEALQKIQVKEAYDYPKPYFVARTLAQFVGEGLLTKEDQTHRKLRRLLGPVFAHNHIKELLPTIYRPTYGVRDIWAERLQEQEKNGQGGQGIVEPMVDWLSRITLDVICAGGFGYFPDTVHDPHNELAAAYEDLLSLESGPSLALMFLEQIIPFLGWLPLRPNIVAWRSMKVIDRVAKEIIESKTNGANSEESKDIISILVKNNIKAEQGGNEYLTKREMQDQVLTFLGAGHETTAAGLSWALWLLSTHQDVQDKLRKELVELMDTSEEPSLDELDDCSYLTCVVKETLRVTPPVAYTAREAKKSDTIAGYYIPKGTLIFFANRAVNMDPRHWGPDSEDYRPERWLELKEDWDPLSFQSFIHGPHGCIGKGLAVAEMKAVIAVLVRNFKFELETPDQVVIKTAAISMRPKGPLPLRVKRID